MIRNRGGIEVETDRKFSVDSYSSTSDHVILSHAHSDHAVKKDSKKVICSDLTRKISEERFDVDLEVDSPEDVDLIPSGHILGSSAFLIDGKVLYTGDVAISDRAYMEGFQPVEADKLIIESTYGIPNYRFPDQGEVEKEVKDWVKDTGEPLFLFGYSLGKAQKIQQMVQEATERPIVAHGSVKKMNDVVERHTDLEFRAKEYKENKEVLDENGIFIAPSRVSKAEFVEKLVEKHGGEKVGFSGWAVDDSYRYRGGYDETFPLSDHCDFDELVELVKEVDPGEVYTHHGFDEAFASYLKKELGFNARALKKNQSSLTDF